MTAVIFLEVAEMRIDETYRYACDHWGDRQGDAYIRGLFRASDGLVSQATPSRPIPARFGRQGYYFRYEKHFVYWQHLTDGDIGIVTVLHEKMHQIRRLRDDLAPEP